MVASPPMDLIRASPQDGVHAPWETLLDTPAYALRVSRDEMAALPAMLRALPPHRVRAMQAALARSWPRFTYLSVMQAEARRARAKRATRGGVDGGRNGGLAVGPRRLAELASRDATATLVAVLGARLRLREARAAGTAGPAAAAELLAPAAGCVRGAFGGDVSPPLPPIDAARAYANREVNGWVI